MGHTFALLANTNENPRTMVDIGIRDEKVEVRLKMSICTTRTRKTHRSDEGSAKTYTNSRLLLALLPGLTAAKAKMMSATPRRTPSSLEMADDMSASEAVSDLRSR